MALKKFLIITLLSLFPLFGCAGGNSEDDKLSGLMIINNPAGVDMGTLKLSLSSSTSSVNYLRSNSISGLLPAASIIPSIDMVPEMYSISGTGPDGSNFSVSTGSETIEVPNLRFGTWDITVEAFNDDASPVSIGSGSNSVAIVAGATTLCTVVVTPYTGFGSLSLALTWSGASVANPAIASTITRNGGIPAVLAFSVSNGSASSLSTLAAGYYTVNTKLYGDGANSTRIFMGGAVDVVRILQDQQTAGTMSIVVNSTVPDGDGGITIDPSMDDPIEVILTGNVATITEGSTLTVHAAAPSETEPVTYTWYLNGVTQSGGSTYTSTGLPVGRYRLDVTAFNSDGSRAGSATCTFEVVDEVTASNIIADHTIVDDYDKIPAYYMAEVKKMMVAFPGESHSLAYRTGMELLEAQNSNYACNVSKAEAYTDQYVRVNTTSAGEAHWYTWYAYDNHNGANKDVVKNYITRYNSNGYPVHALGFAWCWDMVWMNGLTVANDPVFGCGWAGSSEGGPDGNLAWGLDADDYSMTGNRVSMDTYLYATEEYRLYCLSNNYPTRIIFTTGPADGYSGELGYQVHLKHERIRDYVGANSDRILFDYCDILVYNDGASIPNTTTWNGHEYPVITTANRGDGSIGHIGSAGAIRLAKAQWWLLARIAGWDGVTP